MSSANHWGFHAENSYSHGNATRQLNLGGCSLSIPLQIVQWDIKTIRDVRCLGSGCSGLASPQPCPISPPGPGLHPRPSPAPSAGGDGSASGERLHSRPWMPARGTGCGWKHTNSVRRRAAGRRRLLPTNTHLLPAAPAGPAAPQPYRAAYALGARHASTYDFCATGALSGAAPALTTLRKIRKKHRPLWGALRKWRS